MNAVCQKCNNEGSDFGCNTSIVKDEAAGIGWRMCRRWRGCPDVRSLRQPWR